MKDAPENGEAMQSGQFDLFGRSDDNCGFPETPSRRNENAIAEFLGDGPRAVEAYEPPWYYFQLLAWSVKHVAASPGWESISVLGYTSAKPLFSEVHTDNETRESCMTNGQALLKKNELRLVITLKGNSSIQVEASTEKQEAVAAVLQEIKDFMREHNFYKGKKICLEGNIAFLEAGQRDWDSIVLDPDMKDNIHMNTIGFLNNVGRMKEFGIPSKRGIILAGEPGTGKTAVCKALISESGNVTCIVTEAYEILSEGYISYVYEVAQDLSPSMVFIEDIDSMAQERYGFYRGSPPLIALLAEMDGITEKKAIVTVATSNSCETLDKALRERPSRFDRVFTLSLPDYHRRVAILKYLAKKIPLSEDTVEYIAKQTEGFSPAQLQEVPYSMVNSQLNKTANLTEFSRQDADAAICQINRKKNSTMGFKRVSG